MSKTWFISGSSRGLDRAIVEAALAAEDRVLASARNPKPLEPLLEPSGGRLRLASLDVTDEEAAQGAVGLAMRAFDGLDVVVNNAGYGAPGSVEDTSLNSFRRQIEVNLIGTIIVTKAAIPVLRRQRRGHILQVSSVGGRIGAPARAAYSAAKWGIEGFQNRWRARWRYRRQCHDHPVASAPALRKPHMGPAKDGQSTTRSSVLPSGCSAITMSLEIRPKPLRWSNWRIWSARLCALRSEATPSMQSLRPIRSDWKN